MAHQLIANPVWSFQRRGLATNRVPLTDLSDNPTGCCPRFHPDRWDGQELHFERKRFARATSPNVRRVPQDMAPAYAAAAIAIEKARAWEDQQILVLNHILPTRTAEHLFAVGRDVPGLEMVWLDGDYRTQLFEGPYSRASQWQTTFEHDLAERGLRAERVYFYYTTCPACAQAYGRNYVVAVARLLVPGVGS